MSLKQIAAMVGTSVSTVSRVLNNTSAACASRELRERIWEAARETGYLPNEAARQLRKSGRDTASAVHISIVLARITSLEKDLFFSELFLSLEVELLKQKALIDHIIYADETFSQNLSESDGVIILGRCSQQLLSHITAQNKNVAAIWRNSMNFNVDEVICDGQKAAEQAMRHLLSRGHRKIAYIGDCSYESRYVGYCNMMIQNSIPMDYSLIRQTDQTQEEAETALKELLELKAEGKRDFTAILCANDSTAIRVLELLHKEKKKVRESLSVISIDNVEASQDTKPMLTTIHIPRAEMAHMAVVLLLDRIAGGHGETVRIEFPCRLIRRGSVADLSPADP
ncbi:MAG: LacI family transcriptional regulator [Lachnospiraceae bacterium]|nr:LacI family transcriptional regulator [Lachnospiraceae bacterium]